MEYKIMPEGLNQAHIAYIEQEFLKLKAIGREIELKKVVALDDSIIYSLDLFIPAAIAAYKKKMPDIEAHKNATCWVKIKHRVSPIK